MTTDIVREYGVRDVQLVDLRRNRGKAAAQNAAVERATGEVLLFTDVDVSLSPETLRQVVAFFKDNQVGCVVGRVAYSHDAFYPGDITAHRAAMPFVLILSGQGFWWLRHKWECEGRIVDARPVRR